MKLSAHKNCFTFAILSERPCISMQACNNSSLSLSLFVSHFPFHCRSLWPYLPLIVVHDELWTWTRYLWAWTKLSLWLTLALPDTLWLSLAVSGVSGSFWLSLWFTLSLQLIPAHSDSVWLSPYLIFVIYFTLAKFLENKIYTEKRQFFALNL